MEPTTTPATTPGEIGDGDGEAGDAAAAAEAEPGDDDDGVGTDDSRGGADDATVKEVAVAEETAGGGCADSAAWKAAVAADADAKPTAGADEAAACV